MPLVPVATGQSGLDDLAGMFSSCRPPCRYASCRALVHRQGCIVGNTALTKRPWSPLRFARLANRAPSRCISGWILNSPLTIPHRQSGRNARDGKCPAERVEMQPEGFTIKIICLVGAAERRLVRYGNDVGLLFQVTIVFIRIRSCSPCFEKSYPTGSVVLFVMCRRARNSNDGHRAALPLICWNADDMAFSSFRRCFSAAVDDDPG